MTNNTFIQLGNFFVLLSSAIIFLNNVLDFEYKFALLTDVSLIVANAHLIMLILASFFILFFSIDNPFTEEVNFWVTKEKKFERMIYITALVLSSTSDVLEDPNILFSTVIDEQDIHLDSIISDASVFFVLLVNISKGILLVSAISYSFTAIIRYHNSALQIWKGSLLRLLSFFAVVFLTFVLIKTILLEDSFANKQRKEYIDALYKSNAYNFFFQPLFFNIVNDSCLGFLILYSFYFIIYGEDEFLFAFLTFSESLICLKRLNDSHIDDFTFVTAFILFALASASVLGQLFDYGLRKLDNNFTLLNKFVIDICYKSGSLLTILSLLFFILSVFYPWVTFKFIPHPLNLNLFSVLQTAASTIEHIIDSLKDIALTLDPCAQQTYSHSSIPLINQESELSDALLEVRQQIVNRDSFHAICFSPNSPFNIIRTQPSCSLIVQEYDEIVQNFTNVFAQYDTSSKSINLNEINEVFVDEECRAKACEVLTLSTVAAAASSWVPFLSVVGEGAEMGARAAFKVMKLGRRVLFYVPKLILKRRRFILFLNRIRSYLSIKRRITGYSSSLIGLMLPGILLAAVVLASLMFKRKKSAYESFTENFGTKFLFAIYFPLTISSLIMLFVVKRFPSLIEDVLDELPSNFVEASVFTKTGYSALTTAYALSTLGGLLLSASAILYIFEQSATKKYRWIYLLFMLSVVPAVVSLIFYYFDNNTAALQALYVCVGLVSLFLIYSVLVLINNKRTQNGLDARFDYEIETFTLNNNLIQPVIFSLPALYFIRNNIFNDEYYFEVSYRAASSAARMQREIKDTELFKRGVKSISFDFDEINCGATGELVKAAISIIPGADFINVLTDILNQFTSAITAGLNEINELVQALEDVIDIDFINIQFPSIHVPKNFTNLIVFAVPIASLVLLCFAVFLKGQLKKTIGILVLNLNFASITTQLSLQAAIQLAFDMDLHLLHIFPTYSSAAFDSILTNIILIFASFVLLLNTFIEAE